MGSSSRVSNSRNYNAMGFLINRGDMSQNIIVNPPRSYRTIQVYLIVAVDNESPLSGLFNTFKNEIAKYGVFSLVDANDFDNPSNSKIEEEVSQSNLILGFVNKEVDEVNRVEIASVHKQGCKSIFFTDSDQTDSLQKDLNIGSIYKVSSATEIERKVINYVVNTFISAEANKADFEDVTSNIEYSIITSGLTSKAQINRFKSCKDYLYNLFQNQKLETSENSTHHEFGIGMLSFLFSGVMPNSDMIKSFVEVENENGKLPWFENRWAAIQSYFQNDFDQALCYARDALSIAADNNADEWLINDMLVDCSNMLHIKTQVEGRLLLGQNEFQQQIVESNVNVISPFVDRFHSYIYEKALDEEYRYKTKPLGTTFLGGNFQEALGQFQLSFFYSCILGSCTHISLARKVLARTLNKYADIYSDSFLRVKSLDLYLLNGMNKEVRLYLDAYWDDLHNYLIENIDEVWDKPNGLNTQSKISNKCILWSKLYAFFKDDYVDSVSKEMVRYSRQIRRNVSEDYLKSIYRSMSRLKHDYVVDILIYILRSSKLHMGGTLSSILQDINLVTIRTDKLIRLSLLLWRNMKYILEHNGDRFFIAHLINQHPCIFKKLEEHPSVKLEKFHYISLYNMVRGNEPSYISFLNELLAEAKSHFDTNNNSGATTKFFHSPLESIKNVIEKEFSVEYIEIIQNEIIPLCQEIICSTVETNMKAQAIDCINSVMMAYIVNSLEYGFDKTLDNLEYTTETAFPDIWGGFSDVSLNIKKVLYNCLIGEDVEEKIYEAFLSVESFSEKERITLGQCVNYTVRYQVNKNTSVSHSCIVIIASFAKDRSKYVRESIIESLVVLMETDWASFAMQIINLFLIDNEPRVRWSLLRYTEKKSEVSGGQLFEVVVNTLKNDTHFNIRNKALELMPSIRKTT